MKDPNLILEQIVTKERAVAARSRGKVPYTAKNGVFDDRSSDISWWTNGFFAGLLWQLYGVSKESCFRLLAEEIEEKLDQSLMDAGGMDHDSGFKWLLTSGANYAFTQNIKSKNRLLLAASDLAGRFNPAGNFLRAWNDGGDGSNAGVAIIDCLMNLPLLYRASEMTRDPRFSEIATRHADTALCAFVREDGSVCHIVKFDPATGERMGSLGGQGLGHGSAWTRGQAWAVYGFALSFRHTGKRDYLFASEKTAEYFLSHVKKNGAVPADFLQEEACPYEDDSAAAIAACGLIELARATGKKVYREGAERLLDFLTAERCDFSLKSDSILTRCSVAFHGEEHDMPLIYGDYFYTEAVLKLAEKETFVW